MVTGKGVPCSFTERDPGLVIEHRESEVKGTKHDVAEQLLIALEALLPDICQVCKEDYSVERGEVPSLSCKGCRQGFHQACYNRLGIGDSLAELLGLF